MRYPSLTFRQWQALVRHFAKEARGLGGPVVVGVNRLGRPFTAHFHPARRLKPGQVARLVKRLGLTPEEFREWYAGRKR
ncbi:hypothetical protein [Desulfovirgula thermocuniculi]|uniref:hypothetical protein n=1 Tax=Desulfovirgula thermocuniculi TaxID=348842 RepID=UPI000420B1E4|nr:hypothetical protein [Desulfovirgula thermocuniculi]